MTPGSCFIHTASRFGTDTGSPVRAIEATGLTFYSYVFFLFSQLREKIGFIILQNCDGCESHQAIYEQAMYLLILMKDFEVLHSLFFMPFLPQPPEHFEGIYTATTGKEVSSLNA